MGEDVRSGSVAAADYDNDGDIDFVLSGLLGEERITRLYENRNGIFEQTMDELPGMNNGVLAWGDYDNDGDFDLLLSGFSDLILPDITTSTYMTKIYENTDDGFVDSKITLRQFIYSDAEWADYDSDGDLDFIICGRSYSGLKTLIYNNDGGRFIEIDAKLPGVQDGSVAWGDYDQDGDLDILLCGKDENNLPLTKVYTNQSESAGNRPLGPSNLNATASDKSAELSWGPGYDSETQKQSLTYNLTVGTQLNSRDVITGLVWPDGTRQVVAPGNMQHNTNFKINDLAPGTTYYWKVQSIDQSYRSSSFSSSGSFTTLDQVFSSVHNIRSWVKDGEIDFGDYDNDGDLDFIISGRAEEGRITEIYTNNNGIFTWLNIDLPGVDQSDVEWGDFDNDGDLDFILCGRIDNDNHKITRIFENLGEGEFVPIDTELVGVRKGVATWADCDNDGDLDILISGYPDGSSGLLYAFTDIYRNDGANDFVRLDLNFYTLARFRYVDAAWGDYDNDGDLDILIAGDNYGNGDQTKIYTNEGNNNFTELEIELPGIRDGAVSWGDYNNDGNLDFVLTGRGVARSYIYKNLGNGLFEDIQGYIPPVLDASIQWGDYNNDGDLDILLTGYQAEHSIFPTGDNLSAVFSNEGNDQFVNINTDLPPVVNGCARWADWTGDGALDIIVCGDGFDHVRTYQNNIPIKNTAPESPEALGVSLDNNDFLLQWNPANDLETLRSGLSYNVKIGTTSGAIDIKSPMSATDGYRKVVRSGNVDQVTSYKVNLKNFMDAEKNNDLYWSVQALDNGYMGSEFAPEDTIDLSGRIEKVMDVPNDEGGKVNLHWQASDLDHNINYLRYYSIWRALPSGKKSSLNLIQMNSLEIANENPVVRAIQLNGETQYWEWVANQPAHKLPVYSYTCSTLNDSIPGSQNDHVFMISAHTGDPDIFFDSEPISGYSVDNLSPSAPQNLQVSKKSASIVLNWSPCYEKDLGGYLIFRSKNPEINPTLFSPFSETSGIEFTDSKIQDETEYFYVVCAKDIHGNISSPSNEVSTITTAMNFNISSIPETFALHANYPNPCRDFTSISFDIPKESFVSLEIFTTRGEKLKTLISEKLRPGTYNYEWNIGKDLAGAVYICVLRTENSSALIRMVILP